jgi:hypothetical protein
MVKGAKFVPIQSEGFTKLLAPNPNMQNAPFKVRDFLLPYRFCNEEGIYRVARVLPQIDANGSLGWIVFGVVN